MYRGINCFDSDGTVLGSSNMTNIGYKYNLVYNNGNNFYINPQQDTTLYKNGIDHGGNPSITFYISNYDNTGTQTYIASSNYADVNPAINNFDHHQNKIDVTIPSSYFVKNNAYRIYFVLEITDNNPEGENSNLVEEEVGSNFSFIYDPS